MALVAALAGGLFGSFAGSQVRPAFFDARTLREATGLPLLGTVSMIIDDSTKRRERTGLIRFFSGLGALVGAYAAGLAAVFLLAARAA
jgi:hypothetical protein